MYRILSCLLLLCTVTTALYSQQLVEGRIYGKDSLAMAGVSVSNKNTGLGTVSNTSGDFLLNAHNGDTLHFSAVGYVSLLIIVNKTQLHDHLSVYLKPQVLELNTLEVFQKNHSKDSLATRQEYDRIFNYRLPKVGEVVMIMNLGVAVNINQLYKLLSFKKNKAKFRFKDRLIKHEQEMYVDNRYTPELVERWTGLKGDSLADFIRLYRPSYQFLANAPEYDLLFFIKTAYKQYKDSLLLLKP
jgi:hypothetical protein